MGHPVQARRVIGIGQDMKARPHPCIIYKSLRKPRPISLRYHGMHNLDSRFLRQAEVLRCSQLLPGQNIRSELKPPRSDIVKDFSGCRLP